MWAITMPRDGSVWPGENFPRVSGVSSASQTTLSRATTITARYPLGCVPKMELCTCRPAPTMVRSATASRAEGSPPIRKASRGRRLSLGLSSRNWRRASRLLAFAIPASGKHWAEGFSSATERALRETAIAGWSTMTPMPAHGPKRVRWTRVGERMRAASTAKRMDKTRSSYPNG